MRIRSVFLIAVMTIIVICNAVAQKKPSVLTDEFTLTIDYNKTLEEMVAAGNYDVISDFITFEHFPIPIDMIGRTIRAYPRLFYFSVNTKSNDAIKVMAQAGYRPATLAELLALGAADPNAQTKFTIHALGSIWRSGSKKNPHFFAPCLCLFEGDRSLCCTDYDFTWPAGDRFLGIRK